MKNTRPKTDKKISTLGLKSGNANSGTLKNNQMNSKH